ncbi:MAG: copper amine oxidase N-terminal domain-containing protein [Tissierellia bacterium]|nr:copper amine oxidase N-terminal domain-containing protein [Tissierellia bacterium]
MNKKRFALILVVLILISSFPIQGFAQEKPIKIWMYGKYLDSDVPPIIQDGRTLVPLRVISEGLGYHVEWNQQEKAVLIMGLSPLNGLFEKVLLYFVGKTVALDINPALFNAMTQFDYEPTMNDFYINSTQIQMDVPPIIYKDRTMVPIRSISEAIGHKVDWDEVNRTVVIGEGYVAP